LTPEKLENSLQKTLGRDPKFTAAELLRHATVLAANGGAASVTMLGVANAAGAPSGSVYHRFGSRPLLLAEVWLSGLDAFQTFWWSRAEHDFDPAQIAVLPVLWARRHRTLARVLLVHPADHFVLEGCPESISDAIEDRRRKTKSRLRSLADRFLGRTDGASMERTILAFTGVPLAVLRDPLETGRPITQHAETLVRESATCLMRGQSR